MRQSKLYFLIFLFLPSISSGQGSDVDNQKKLKTNLEIFEGNIAAQLEKFFYYPGVDRSLSFVFSVNHAEGGGDIKRSENEERFINNVIKKSAQNNKLKFSLIDRPENISQPADTNYNIVRLQIYNLETKYTGFKKNVFLGEKTLERNIRIKIGIGITLSDDKFLFNDIIASDYKDEIPYDDHKKLESQEYEFTKGTIPEVGFLERIVVPIALVTVSAAAIVLFFMIRTK